MGTVDVQSEHDIEPACGYILEAPPHFRTIHVVARVAIVDVRVHDVPSRVPRHTSAESCLLFFQADPVRRLTFSGHADI